MQITEPPGVSMIPNFPPETCGSQHSQVIENWRDDNECVCKKEISIY